MLGAMPFTIDYRKPQLVLHTRESFRPPRRVTERKMLLDGVTKPQTVYDRANPHAGAPTVTLSINDERADAILDTGFAGSIVLLPNLIKDHPDWVQRDDGPAARAAGAGGVLGMAGRDMMHARVDNLRALGMRFTNIRSAMALESELPGESYDAVIGSRILSQFRLTFDYTTGCLWAEFDPPPRRAAQ